MSAITLLGTPQEVYRFGTQYCLLVLSYPFVMASAAHLYLPVFWKLQVSTSYEVECFIILYYIMTNVSREVKSAPLASIEMTDLFFSI